MGAPSDEQIDEMIAWGLANCWSEARILRHLVTLERLDDEELAAELGLPVEVVKGHKLSAKVTE